MVEGKTGGFGRERGFNSPLKGEGDLNPLSLPEPPVLPSTTATPVEELGRVAPFLWSAPFLLYICKKVDSCMMRGRNRPSNFYLSAVTHRRSSERKRGGRRRRISNRVLTHTHTHTHTHTQLFDKKPLLTPSNLRILLCQRLGEKNKTGRTSELAKQINEQRNPTYVYSEVKSVVKTLNLCSFGNATYFGDTSLHTESEDVVEQSATFSHYKPQINSTKQEMDTQLFSPLFGGITNTPSAVESPQLYSSWSTCEDEDCVSAVASLQDCTKQRAQVNLSSSGSGPDMFGLVTSILEEPNKPESLTDWNSLSKLFPPVCSSDLENSDNFSGLFSKTFLENKDLTNLVDAQDPYEETVQKFSEADDLYLIGSWLAPSVPCTQQSPDEILKNTNPENRAFQSPEVSHLSSLAYQKVNDHDKEQLNAECGKSHADSSMLSSQAKIKDSTNTYTGYQNAEKARGTLWKNDREGATQYFTQLSNSFADGVWNPVIQENMSPKRCAACTAACDTPQFSCPSLYFLSPTFNKENRFPQGMDTKLQDTYPQNSHHDISTEKTFGNREGKVPVHLQKGSGDHLPLKAARQNVNSSYHGYTGLDNKMLNPVAAPYVAHEKQKQMSPRLSSAQSNESSAGQSVAQPSSSQMPLVPSSRKYGKLQISTNSPNSSGLSSFTENWRQHHLIGQAQNASLATEEGHRSRASINASSNWLSQKHSVSEPTKYRRLHNKQSQYNTNERTMLSEKRCKNNWIPQAGYVGPNCAQFNVLGRRPEQNGGSLSDFINPSFLPLFPLVPGYKQTPAFPPFNPPSFSSPANVAFSPLPFPLSELVDIFHYDDFHHLSPLINDLLCGDIAAPRFAFPLPFNNYRPPKNRSGPANELHIHLEECYEQWRALERERKKTEADLAKNFPGKRVPISISTPFSRLPAKPSRVDRLIVDQFREQARVNTLIEKMEKLCGVPVHHNVSATMKHHLEAICATQARRKDEIVNSANSPRQGPSRYNSEKDVLALAAAIKNLAFSTRKTRTALWCALQMTLPKTLASRLVKKEDIERALQELCPIRGSSPAKYDVPSEESQQVIK